MVYYLNAVVEKELPFSTSLATLHVYLSIDSTAEKKNLAIKLKHTRNLT